MVCVLSVMLCYPPLPFRILIPPHFTNRYYDENGNEIVEKVYNNAPPTEAHSLIVTPDSDTRYSVSKCFCFD